MENNEVSKSNKIKIIVITALIFLVSIAGISYAYFTIQITGNDTASSMRQEQQICLLFIMMYK